MRPYGALLLGLLLANASVLVDDFVEGGAAVVLDNSEYVSSVAETMDVTIASDAALAEPKHDSDSLRLRAVRDRPRLAKTGECPEQRDPEHPQVVVSVHHANNLPRTSDGHFWRKEEIDAYVVYHLELFSINGRSVYKSKQAKTQAVLDNANPGWNSSCWFRCPRGSSFAEIQVFVNDQNFKTQDSCVGAGSSGRLGVGQRLETTVSLFPCKSSHGREKDAGNAANAVSGVDGKSTVTVSVSSVEKTWKREGPPGSPAGDPNGQWWTDKFGKHGKFWWVLVIGVVLALVTLVITTAACKSGNGDSSDPARRPMDTLNYNSLEGKKQASQEDPGDNATRKAKKGKSPGNMMKQKTQEFAQNSTQRIRMGLGGVFKNKNKDLGRRGSRGGAGHGPTGSLELSNFGRRRTDHQREPEPVDGHLHRADGGASTSSGPSRKRGTLTKDLHMGRRPTSKATRPTGKEVRLDPKAGSWGSTTTELQGGLHSQSSARSPALFGAEMAMGFDAGDGVWGFDCEEGGQSGRLSPRDSPGSMSPRGPYMPALIPRQSSAPKSPGLVSLQLSPQEEHRSSGARHAATPNATGYRQSLGVSRPTQLKGSQSQQVRRLERPKATEANRNTATTRPTRDGRRRTKTEDAGARPRRKTVDFKLPDHADTGGDSSSN